VKSQLQEARFGRKYLIIGMVNTGPRISVEEWNKRHADSFSFNGQIGGNLISVDDAELHAGHQIIERFPRQSVLLDSFMGFFLETLELSGERVMSAGWPADGPHYAAMFAYFSNLFRRFRCCDILFMKG